jgi:hypothetical protein
MSKVGRELQDADDDHWDRPAIIWPSVQPSLVAWSGCAFSNSPRAVPLQGEPEWIMEVDASAWGWGYFALNESTGEIRMHGEAWSQRLRAFHGDKFSRSTFAEPHGIHNALCHLLSGHGPRRVRLGTDSTVSKASFSRGFNSHSYDINEVLRANRAAFGPEFSFQFLHVPGSLNVADSLSRGGAPLSEEEIASARESLRRMLGSEERPRPLRQPDSAPPTSPA